MAPDPAAFWAWFGRYRENIEAAVVKTRSGSPPPHLLTDGLSEALRGAGFDLAYEVGQRPSGTFHLIISADGQPERIPDVLALMRAAPAYPKWEVTPFRPPSEGDFDVQIAPGKVIPMACAVFYIEETRDYTAVVMMFDTPIAAELSSRELNFVARRFVEIRLGEYKTMNDIDYVHGAPLLSDVDHSIFRPFSEFEAAMRELDGSIPH